jgi:hypothetical protein
MLERILGAVQQGGTLDAVALARLLDTSPQMVEAMLEHLQRAGYLQEFADCNDGCGGCSLQGACNSAQKRQSFRLWQS